MCKFEEITYDKNLHYIPYVRACYGKYFKYLQDDYSQDYTDNIFELIQRLTPYFWIVLDFNDNFMGFAYLDNFIRNDISLYSAELTICFDVRAWGSFIRYSGKFFLKKCFDELGLQKIKAHIYPDNFRVKSLLKDSGFVYESTLKNETLRFGKPQDIEVFGLYRTYYY